TTATRSSPSPPTTRGRGRWTSGTGRPRRAASASAWPTTSPSRRRATTCTASSRRARSTERRTRESSGWNNRSGQVVVRGITSAAPTFAPGTQFAGYLIDGVAGRGGMGIVYRATQLALNRPVALKLLSPVYAADDDFRERFKREWETAAAIDHPNVIPLYEAGEANGHLFIAMRFVDGVDLANLIAREEIAPARAVRLLGAVASALDAAHARGPVHRDVKPANMLVDPGDHVYLTDFGLSRGMAQSRLTRTGLFVGSTDYAAPEQIRGEDTDARTDVYALGCVLYQLLTRE